MDPYYFINDLSITENDEELELHDICQVGYDGSWSLGQKGETLIIHKDEQYNFINFNNETKELQFVKNEEVIKTIVLYLSKKCE